MNGAKPTLKEMPSHRMKIHRLIKEETEEILEPEQKNIILHR
jgi:hypothetical protein